MQASAINYTRTYPPSWLSPKVSTIPLLANDHGIILRGLMQTGLCYHMLLSHCYSVALSSGIKLKQSLVVEPWTKSLAQVRFWRFCDEIVDISQVWARSYSQCWGFAEPERLATILLGSVGLFLPSRGL